jgi:hypothetical protein
MVGSANQTSWALSLTMWAGVQKREERSGDSGDGAFVKVCKAGMTGPGIDISTNQYGKRVL